MATKKRETVIDLHTYLGKRIQVKFIGGRVVQGTLVGFDKLFNLVLSDNVTEDAPPDSDVVETSAEYVPRVLDEKDAPRIVCRGSQVMTITPMDGLEEIANPWLNVTDQME